MVSLEELILNNNLLKPGSLKDIVLTFPSNEVEQFDSAPLPLRLLRSPTVCEEWQDPNE